MFVSPQQLSTLQPYPRLGNCVPNNWTRKKERKRSAVALSRCLAAMPPEGSTRAGILPGCPSLDRGSRVAEVGFEPRTFRTVFGPSWSADVRLDRTTFGVKGHRNPYDLSRDLHVAMLVGTLHPIGMKRRQQRAVNTEGRASIKGWKHFTELDPNSCLCAVPLSGSIKINAYQRGKWCLFVESVYSSKNCSSETEKGQFYQNLSRLFPSARRKYIVILADDIGGRLRVDAQRTDNCERLLHLCADHRLFLDSANFQQKHSHQVTTSFSVSVTRTEAEHLHSSTLIRIELIWLESYWKSLVMQMSKITGGVNGRELKLSEFRAVCPSHLARLGGQWISLRLADPIVVRKTVPAISDYDGVRMFLKHRMIESLKDDRMPMDCGGLKLEKAFAAGNSRSSS
ncbi:hypothetical protein T265_08188 [Opisthorchis viverrini]|uniref:Uncharacterized protein n=1 Tax=Opisthorchis viverrini TaxID=6198 RepID=A0A074Z9Y1_OPIVI|nr:hypothetical protein T265_08188 [Opisthorchis viverrini]KER24056.1 hypothetical protein T265_08188 [Opisthorchis viverrini]